MASTEGTVDSDEELQRLSAMFLTSELALWAGDAVHAEQLLTQILSHSSNQHASVSTVTSPLVASANHRRRQLRLRQSEFDTLGRSVGLSDEQLRPAVRHVSGVGHLAGIIHVVSDREFEFRCYLNDLGWEAPFYERLIALSPSESTVADARVLGYGRAGENIQRPQEEGESSLGLDFYLPPDEAITYIQVSDFCTFQARSVWIDNIPMTAEEIESYFQKLLDQIDT
jgi:hypothetical protein